MTWSVLNIDELKKAVVIEKPFPYFVIDNIIRPEVLTEVVRGFPQIEQRGSFPIDAYPFSGKFETFIQELQREELRDLIGEKFSMDLEENPSTITLKGFTTERDGLIHVDSSTKLITVLIYLNLNWQAEGGKLRLLYNNKDLEPYAAEVAPEAGRCLIFKVTKDCWHGHAPFVGERHSIQLNYVTSEEARDRHLKRHRFSAFMKKIFSKDREKEPAY